MKNNEWSKESVLNFKPFSFTKTDLHNALREMGNKYLKQGKNDWSPTNPTRGYCAIIIRMLKETNKIPDGFKIFRFKDNNDGGSHYYFMNPNTNDVIDLSADQAINNLPYESGKEWNVWFPQINKGVYVLAEKLGFKINK